MSKKMSLAELRAQVKKKNEGKSNYTENNDVYPHWNIDVDATATVRILPDKNEDNENHFYVEKREHKISINGKDRKIACIQMYGEKCPICTLSSKYYKAEGKESVQGKYFYHKKTALLKALILKDPISKDGHESAVGQVKTMQFTNQIMKEINSQLANEEEETALTGIPWDLDAGHNFIIKKTKQGQYDNYSSGTVFSTKLTAIADEYMDAVEEGMIDLVTLLPPNPGLEKVQALLEAHLSGSDEDEEAEDGQDKVDEAPPRRRAAAEPDADEAPPRRRVVTEDDDAPPRRRAAATEEDEAPPRRRRASTEEDEVAATPAKQDAAVDSDLDPEEEALVARIRNRKRNA